MHIRTSVVIYVLPLCLLQICWVTVLVPKKCVHGDIDTFQIQTPTRMHSSRMRTARTMTVGGGKDWEKYILY